MKKQVDDYIQDGIFGPRQTNPDERRKFLGTVRERIILALTKEQISKDLGLQELEKLMKDYRGAKMLLNGNMDAAYFNTYRKLASMHKIPYTIVTNKDIKTDIALLLAYESKAINIEEIYLKEEMVEVGDDTKEKPNGKKSLFKRLFGIKD